MAIFFSVLSVSILVLAAFIGAALLGIPEWRRGTVALDDYIDISEKAEGTSNRRHRHIVRSERRRTRLRRTIGRSLLGAIFGLGVVFAFVWWRYR